MSFNNKAPAMQKFLNDTAKQMFGRTIEEAYQQSICVMCGQHVDLGQYEDIDIKEYNISGIGTCCFPSDPED